MAFMVDVYLYVFLEVTTAMIEDCFICWPSYSLETGPASYQELYIASIRCVPLKR